jgi:hypothetical protein
LLAPDRGVRGLCDRYLAGTGRQFSADLNGEVQVRLTTRHLLQAFSDERGGLGNVTAALGEPRAQEDRIRRIAARRKMRRVDVSWGGDETRSVLRLRRDGVRAVRFQRRLPWYHVLVER